MKTVISRLGDFYNQDGIAKAFLETATNGISALARMHKEASVAQCAMRMGAEKVWDVYRKGYVTRSFQSQSDVALSSLAQMKAEEQYAIDLSAYYRASSGQAPATSSTAKYALLPASLDVDMDAYDGDTGDVVRSSMRIDSRFIQCNLVDGTTMGQRKTDSKQLCRHATGTVSGLASRLLDAGFMLLSFQVRESDGAHVYMSVDLGEAARSRLVAHMEAAPGGKVHSMAAASFYCNQ